MTSDISKQNIPVSIITILTAAGYTLDEHQPHTLGERFLMQNITTPSGKKIILLGKNKQRQPVVIKVALDETGKKELKHERACRNLLQSINFAYNSFYTPEEQAFWSEAGVTVSVQTFIEQSSSFIDRPIEEQFFYALTAFKTQESARATTKSHYRAIARTFGIRTSGDYIAFTKKFFNILHACNAPQAILETVTTAIEKIKTNQERIEQYCGFLTHTDFVPHNFRISDDKIYLLDSSSLEFGNKHEGWARFLNFMTLYNHELETLLITYVEQNRAPEERESLQLMRLYRLIEIITYYTKTLVNSTGDLRTLNETRVQFWHAVLQAELQNRHVDRAIVTTYQTTRDQLRSDSEKERQKNLH